ncbi:MAG: lactate racemase domain-containing protein [Thermodesulfobacteriota bacterium]
MEFPKMAKVSQTFDPQHIEDVRGETQKEVAALQLQKKVQAGQTVAITAGSRGIANIDVITRALVDELKKLGARPFIFPAMGSHGGATDRGQIKVLENFGITEAAMGCPICSSMEVVFLGDASDGYPIYVDKFASEADHIVVVNRVKAHTKFEGPIESGLMKMMAIGMGKHKGAEYYHSAAVRLTFQRIVENVGLEVIKRCPVLFGLGIVENAYHQTCLIKALSPESIFEGEKKLLAVSKQRTPHLPFDEIDVLVIDQMGKDISGTGMDTKVIGRNRDILGDFVTGPRIKRLFVRDLTDDTEGSAIGIGYADFTTTRLVNKMDRHKTYVNCMTAISPEKGAIPMYFDTDREALEACFTTIGDIPADQVRMVHIKNTLALESLSISQAFEKEIRQKPDLKLLEKWKEIELDNEGNLVSPFAG